MTHLSNICKLLKAGQNTADTIDSLTIEAVCNYMFKFNILLQDLHPSKNKIFNYYVLCAISIKLLNLSTLQGREKEDLILEHYTYIHTLKTLKTLKFKKINFFYYLWLKFKKLINFLK